MGCTNRKNKEAVGKQQLLKEVDSCVTDDDLGCGIRTNKEALGKPLKEMDYSVAETSRMKKRWRRHRICAAATARVQKIWVAATASLHSANGSRKDQENGCSNRKNKEMMGKRLQAVDSYVAETVEAKKRWLIQKIWAAATARIRKICVAAIARIRTFGQTGNSRLDFNEKDVEIVDDDVGDEAEKEAKDDEGKEELSADELDEAITSATAEAEALPRAKATISLDDPGLQMPKPAKSDWKAEMESIKKLVGNGGSGKQTKQFHDALTQQIEDIRALEEAKNHFQKKFDDVQQEAQRNRNEEARVSSVKTKLETTCQELQEQIKSIADENQKIAEEERQRHAELQGKFDHAIRDMQEKMDAEAEVHQHFVKENDELRTKLAKFTESFEEEKGARARDMKLKKKQLIEYETTWPRAKVNAEKLEKQNEVLRKSQAALRSQLQGILAKFDEVHASVTGSNEQHGDCKTETDKLQVELAGLEQDNADLLANAHLHEMEKERDVAKKQTDALEKLCNNLSKECAKQRDLLRALQSGKAGG